MSEHPTGQADDQWAGDGEAAPQRSEGEKAAPQPEHTQVEPASRESAAPEPAKKAPSAMKRQTRIGAAWVAVAVAVIVLVLLLIFILQNQQGVDVRYFAAKGHLPLGVLVLFSAAGGALLVVVLGAARILQLQWLARRDRKSTAPSRPRKPSRTPGRKRGR